MNSPLPPRARSQAPTPRSAAGFTLIELLVVISIIIVLIGFSVPVFQNVQNSAKKTQAKNDLMQIVTAVNAFYTEYGQYPCAANPADDTADFLAADDSNHTALMTNLRAKPGATLNTRQIVFLSAPDAKDPTPANARSGIASDGRFYDAWGTPYRVRIDNNYNNLVRNPYAANTGAGPTDLSVGVAGWSFGRNRGGGTGAKSSSVSTDDVISWQ